MLGETPLATSAYEVFLVKLVVPVTEESATLVKIGFTSFALSLFVTDEDEDNVSYVVFLFAGL